MEVARAVKHEGRELRFMFAIELVDLARRRGEAEMRSPIAQVERGKMQRFAAPGAVKIDMQTDVQNLLGRVRTKTTFARLRHAKIFGGSTGTRVEPQRFLVFQNRL